MIFHFLLDAHVRFALFFTYQDRHRTFFKNVGASNCAIVSNFLLSCTCRFLNFIIVIGQSRNPFGQITIVKLTFLVFCFLVFSNTIARKRHFENPIRALFRTLWYETDTFASPQNRRSRSIVVPTSAKVVLSYYSGDHFQDAFETDVLAP